MKIFDSKNTISIEEEDLLDAKLSSADFASNSTKKRALVNVLGARLAMKMLFSKKIEAHNVYSLYTIHNFLEEMDIADIYINNVRIDVRVVFDRNEIFIPKTHFNYGITPDLYFVLQLKEDFSCFEPLGFFEPKNINKNNQNTDYYFFEHEDLIPVKEIKSTLKTIQGSADSEIPQEDIENAEILFLSLADKEISNKDKNYLIQQLSKSKTLREKFVEFENFEIISNEIAKNEELIKDGVLNIIGAQKAFEEEISEQTQSEIKAEVIGEVLSDLILEDNLIENAAEIEPEKPIEKDEDFLNELQESTNSVKKENKDHTGTIIATAVAGSAIIGSAASAAAAAASANAAITTEATKAGLDAIASGLEMGTNLADKASEVLSDILETSNTSLEEDDFDLDDLDFESLDADEEKTTPETNDETETAEEIEFENLDTDESEVSEESTNEIQEEEINFEDLIDKEATSEENSYDELQNESMEEETDLEGLIEDEAKNLDEIESELKDIDFSEELEKFEAPIEEELNLSSDLEMDKFEESLPELEGSLEDINIDLESLENDFNKTVKIEEEKENPIANSTIDNSIMEDAVQSNEIDELIAQGDFSLDALKEKVDSSLFDEDKPDYKLFGIDEDALNAELPQYLKQEQETIDEISEPENTDKAEEEITTPEIISTELTNKTDSSDKLTDSDEQDFEEIERLIEEAEEQTKPSDNLDLQNDDDFLKEVDDFLQNIELSDENLSLLDELVDQDSLANLSDLYSDTEQPKKDEDKTLQLLFNDKNTEENTQDDKLETYETEDNKLTLPSTKKDKKMVIAASIATFVLISLAIGGGIISNQNASLNNQIAQAPAVNQSQDVVDPTKDMNMGLSDQVPEASPNAPLAAPDGSSAQMAPDRDMGAAVSDVFSAEPVNASISKVAWEVPEELAYNDGFRSYLQIAGKNLKLNLQNDLLAATDIAYSNKVVVNLSLSPTGGLTSSNIATSSGSKQIDSIVLQSVKETLMYLKVPSDELRGKSVNAILIINF